MSIESAVPIEPPSVIDTLIGDFTNRERALKSVLKTAAKLSPSDWESEILRDTPSIQLTLNHVITGIDIWLGRWTGKERDIPEEFDLNTLTGMRSYLDVLMPEVKSYIAGLTPEDLSRDLIFTSPDDDITRAYRLGDAIKEGYFHMHEHISVAAAMLTSLGHSPGDLGFLGRAHYETVPDHCKQ